MIKTKYLSLQLLLLPLSSIRSTLFSPMKDSWSYTKLSLLDNSNNFKWGKNQESAPFY